MPAERITVEAILAEIERRKVTLDTCSKSLWWLSGPPNNRMEDALGDSAQVCEGGRDALVGLAAWINQQIGDARLAAAQEAP